jgi:choline dehydrogenase-like flavoprotein
MRTGGTGISNGRDIPTGTIKEADVCVIGAGPAGISAAWKLGEAGLKVILLDGSRQLDYSDPHYYRRSWPDKKELYDGEATGLFATNEPEFLIRPASDAHGDFPWERERVFGGTATHGGGQCRPQDPVDIEGRVFEGKTIFPAWPILRWEFEKFYREASVANHLSGEYPDNFTAEFWQQTLGLNNAIPKLAGFDVGMYQFMGDPPEGKWKNFATRPWGERQETIEHFVQVIVNATVLNIVVAGGGVYWLDVASMEDRYPDQPMKPDNPKVATEFKVRAPIYILACGAVENARQLLLSKIGDNKLVGHYFMCHPFSGWRDPMIKTTKTYLSGDQPKLMAGNDRQNRQWHDPLFGNYVEGRFITNPDTTRRLGIGRCWFWAKNKGESSPVYFEMAPNYESYVELEHNPPFDPVFGKKRTKIHWSLTETDQRTYEENCKEFQSSIRTLPLQGEISYPSWEEMKEKWVPNGHHMGTTRMSVKVEEGVVDENLKVHGVDNLYVAGASVFPSGGISNPTMTIVALSLRLAEHVRSRLGKS